MDVVQAGNASSCHMSPNLVTMEIFKATMAAFSLSHHVFPHFLFIILRFLFWIIFTECASIEKIGLKLLFE